jgi:hypothetical protein
MYCRQLANILKFICPVGYNQRYRSGLERNDMMRQHDKIINMAAKKILAPHGLFRQGTSRTWLDDNGYISNKDRGICEK